MDEAVAGHAKLSSSAWARLFHAQLEQFQWPGKGLGSFEYQQWRHWLEALEEFANHGSLLGPMGFDQALLELRRLLREAVFQPEGPAAAVQVLGLLESSGMAFDELWLCGYSDRHWPQAASPHPLLPLSLQRRLEMPHATADRQLAYGRSLLEGYHARSRRLIASYCRYEGELECRPARLLAQMRQSEAEAPPLAVWERQQWIAQIRSSAATAMEKLPSGQAPSVQEPERPGGGSSLLQNQSACPFRAFAIHRLGARDGERPVNGLSSMEQGSLVHKALEQLWGDFEDSRALLEATPAEQRKWIEQAVDAALQDMLRDRRHGPRLLELERERLGRLLQACLRVEAQRPPFAVDRHEQSFAGLELRVQMDRVDRLGDGSLLVIDYKTGLARRRDWQGDRPASPQLPLYALLLEDQLLEDQQQPVAAIAYALVSFFGNTEGMKFEGVGNEQTMEWLPEGIQARLGRTDKEDQWDRHLQRWRQVLEGLVRDFMAGRAAVDPASGACQYCDLPGLCRVQEHGG